MHWQTHTVFNQPIPLNNSNLYLSDGALCEAVTREGAGWDSDFLASIGQQLGTAESLELGRLANVNPPEFLQSILAPDWWVICCPCIWIFSRRATLSAQVLPGRSMESSVEFLF